MAHALSPTEIQRLLDGAHSFRSRLQVRAVRVLEESEWRTTHGEVLHAQAGDWWVIDGDDRWSVADDVFANTYEQLDGDHYRKTATVTAARIRDAFALQTLEGLAAGEPGDWLVRNPSGECWPVTSDVFKRRYVRVQGKQ
ncbi:hypothetical protein C6A86_023585 [Mycobacterium sp. ITM-2016-00316]|uniref:hypothetical protein n=1 Tax=Mycobacterium sp. ITM-2016-00316 TaxID=2099695 RepID=UPI001158A49D|nr:hypothetical protein [Mycobacterium sp. ITM-2016-00316]WNG81143.1 hypothetical protein C6A86_023585 [Mycobacterium sp. ITM-2016-00316]